MTQLIRWIGILALVWAAGCGKKEAQVVTPQAPIGSEVAVWVDDVGITGEQIQTEVKRLYSHVPKNVDPDKLPAIQMRLLQTAVDNLVVRQLVRAEMERSGILVSQEEIEKGKADLEKGLGEGQSLAMLLAAANLPMEELEMNLRLDLFKNKVLKEKQIAAVEAVTDEQVRAYYDEHPEEFTKPAGRIAEHILVSVPADADEAVVMDRRAKAEGIRKAILEGADFATLAAEESECSSRANGGKLGVIPRGREAKAFEDAVYSQEIGAIGELVRSPVGFHIIRVTGEQQEELVPFDEIQERLAMAMKTKARQQIAADYIKELREKAVVRLDGPLAAAVEAAKVATAQAEAAAADAPLIEGAAPATVPGTAPATVPAP